MSKVTFEELQKYIKNSRVLPSKQVDLDTVKSMLDELQAEYVPEVSMTKEEFKIFNDYRIDNDLPAPFTTLLANINEYNVNDWSDEAFGTLSEEDLMTAWLHPESIVVEVDE